VTYDGEYFRAVATHELPRTALIARLDTSPTKADWAAWERDLEARLG
jgi:hypothetical protein